MISLQIHKNLDFQFTSWTLGEERQQQIFRHIFVWLYVAFLQTIFGRDTYMYAIQADIIKVL